jgi:hypothetical protein
VEAVSAPTNSLCERCVSDGELVAELCQAVRICPPACASRQERAATALEARIAACGCKPHPDTVRLDWLVGVHGGTDGRFDFHWLWSVYPNGNVKCFSENTGYGSRDLRAAIDAAKEGR